MTRCIDEVDLVAIAVRRLVLHAHGRRLDRDPPLSLEIHAVEELLTHVTVGDCPGELQQPVRQRALPMIDVCDDRYRALMQLFHRKDATPWRDGQEAAGRSTMLCYPLSPHPDKEVK
jgi:hypothetical protein